MFEGVIFVGFGVVFWEMGMMLSILVVHVVVVVEVLENGGANCCGYYGRDLVSKCCSWRSAIFA